MRGGAREGGSSKLRELGLLDLQIMPMAIVESESNNNHNYVVPVRLVLETIYVVIRDGKGVISCCIHTLIMYGAEYSVQVD